MASAIALAAGLAVPASAEDPKDKKPTSAPASPRIAPAQPSPVRAAPPSSAPRVQPPAQTAPKAQPSPSQDKPTRIAPAPSKPAQPAAPPKAEPPKAQPPRSEPPKVQPPRSESPKVSPEAPRQVKPAQPPSGPKAPDAGPKTQPSSGPKGPDTGPRTQPGGPPQVKPAQPPIGGSPIKPDRKIDVKPTPRESIKPAAPAAPRGEAPSKDGGFKPTGPAPRTDRPDRGGGRDSVMPAVAPGTARRVSDRADRFSQVANASPALRRDSHDGRWRDDHDDYWDGYRDGYRRGYRNGWRDYFWDDCWWPHWRRHNSFSFSFGFSSGCWDGWWLSVGYGSPHCWYPPVHHYYYTPVWYYRPAVTYSTVTTTTSWDGSTTVTTYYNPAPRFEVVDFCEEVCAPTQIVYQPVLQTAGPRVVDINVPTFQPTIYRSDDLAGLLTWNDTPEAVAAGVAAAADRASASAQFLGRIPAGAWDGVYEGERFVEGRTELLFRGLAENSRGRRVQIIVVPKGASPDLRPGQRVQLTGRLAEICVDDPFEPAGRLTLLDGSFRS